MSDKTSPVKIYVLKVIYQAMMPSYHRLNSLLEDVLSGNFVLSETEKANLMDITSCATTLKVIFEEYFDQAFEHKVDTIYLPNSELQNIINMSKLVESAQRVSFSNVGIWSH